MAELRKILAPLASLRLTIALLVASMFLVLAGTLAQIDNDVFVVQKAFFHSWWVWVPFQSFFPRPYAGHDPIPGGIPFLGGYTLIILLLVNLLSAHTVRFKLSWKRSGVLLIHFGLVLLLAGEVVSSLVSRDQQTTIDEGQTKNWTEDTKKLELAVVDRSPKDHDSVVVVPGSQIYAGSTIHDSRLPFDVHIDDFAANSEILGPGEAGDKYDPHATAGIGTVLTLQPIPRFSGVGAEAGAINQASAYATFTSEGKKLGTYLLTQYSSSLSGPQVVTVDGHEYWVQLRFQRTYKPYSITLIHFTHENYLGTDRPKNFASLVRVMDPSHGVDRHVKIWMNHPLRFDGDVIYQQSFKPGDKTSVLEVVDNPGRRLPYIACAIGALGMLIHFSMVLIAFLRRRSAENAEALRQSAASSARQPTQYTLRARLAFSPAALLAMAVVACAAVSIFIAARPAQPSDPGAFDYNAFGRMPVVADGRTMPIDSLARNTLRLISNIDEVHYNGQTLSADQWIVEAMANTELAHQMPVFRVDLPDLINYLQLDASHTRFSLNELNQTNHLDEIQKQALAIDDVPTKDRDLYQQKVHELWGHVLLYLHLQYWSGNPDGDWRGLYIFAPLAAGEQWRTFADEAHRDRQNPRGSQSAEAIFNIMHDYRDANAGEFNTDVSDYLSLVHKDLAGAMRPVDYEAFFNHFEPFYQCMILYVAAFVLAALSWLLWRGFGTAALAMLIFTLLVHTFGLASRMYISGRPPVTNLYSSAVFIGWGAVVLAIALELMYRNGVATALAAIVGFTTLVIAHHLMMNPVVTEGGDSMSLLQAVLDTNFWLATHVVGVTLGYATTFLSGVIAWVYVIGGMFFPQFDAKARKQISRMLYGTICFAIFFSFVGTILGGIWADQSWGRFWGWDPKENGAILVVLWNALILHARWSGIARQRGVALLAIFGNIVTSWSWFGTNLLGVGLHSYGFMAGSAMWLQIFMLSQMSLIAIGLIPTKYWRSFAADPAL